MSYFFRSNIAVSHALNGADMIAATNEIIPDNSILTS